MYVRNNMSAYNKVCTLASDVSNVEVVEPPSLDWQLEKNIYIFKFVIKAIESQVCLQVKKCSNEEQGTRGT